MNTKEMTAKEIKELIENAEYPVDCIIGYAPKHVVHAKGTTRSIVLIAVDRNTGEEVALNKVAEFPYAGTFIPIYTSLTSGILNALMNQGVVARDRNEYLYVKNIYIAKKG